MKNTALNKLNKKLCKEFDGRVKAGEENGLLVLSGELERWVDVVRAGEMSVDKKRYIGLVNDIHCASEQPAPPRMPEIVDKALDGERPDVLVIGGGVVGSAITRELTRYNLKVLLVEKEHDLAMHTSSRNDGMVHTGADLKKGTQKYHYNRLGKQMYADICADLGVEFRRMGQLVCLSSQLAIPAMYLSLLYWRWLGMEGVKVYSRKKLLKAEPVISDDCAVALYFPDTGIVCPYVLTIAYAENAVQNGANVSLNTYVSDFVVEDGIITEVKTNRGIIYPKVVVNASGVFSEEIAKLAKDRFFSIHPRKGTNAILDKKCSDIIVQTALSSRRTMDAKKAHTKGGGVMRTVHENTLVGPDAEETIEKEDFTTTRGSIERTFQHQGMTCPALSESQIITYFSGIRASTYEEDFVVCKGKFTKNIVHAAGIQSPGLTAAPAIGIDVASMAVDLLGGLETVRLNTAFNPKRTVTPSLANLDDSARAKFIEENPDYGIIVCRCEEVSKGEILDAMRRNIPCYTIDAVKRRVRPGMGRCQGGFCGPLVLELIAREKGMDTCQVRKSGFGSELLLRDTK